MQYIEYVKLALGVLSLLVSIAKDVKAGGTDSDNIVNRIVATIPQIGEVADMKELRGLDVSVLAPEVKNFLNGLRELRRTPSAS